jgi:hypothetical protein
VHNELPHSPSAGNAGWWRLSSAKWVLLVVFMLLLLVLVPELHVLVTERALGEHSGKHAKLQSSTADSLMQLTVLFAS